MSPLGLPEMLLLGGVAASSMVPYVLEQFSAGPSDVPLRRFARKELGLADYLVYEELLEPNLVLTTSPALGAMYEISWDDTSTVDDVTHMAHVAAINDALRRKESGWMHQSFTLRVLPSPPVLPSFLVGDAHRALAESHAAALGEQRRGWRHLVALAYKPPAGEQKWLHKMVFTGDSQLEASFSKVKGDFDRSLQAYEDALGRVASIRRLGVHPEDPTRNELLEAVFELVTGDRQPIRVGVPFESAPIGGLLAARDVTPVGTRPKVGDKHLRILAVYGYPGQSNPGMLDAFLRIPASRCRFTTRCIFQDVEQAKAKLDKRRREWTAQKTSLVQKAMPGGLEGRVDRYAAANEEAVEKSILSIQAGGVALVNFSAKVVFLDEDLEALEAAIREAKKVFAAAGFTAKEETVNTFEAYLGSVPFDGYHDVREVGLDTGHVACLWPSSAPWRGRHKWNCKQCGPATVPALLGLCDTGEDFAWDPHDGESQSYVAIGAPDAGKSTDLNTLAANYRRAARDQVFTLDKNRGQLVTAAFLGGVYHEADRYRYCLFDDLEDADSREYLGQFLVKLAEINDFAVEPDHRAKIKAAIEGMLQLDRPRDRSLSTFLGSVLGPRDKEKKLTETLGQYAEGGAFKGIFDGRVGDVGSGIGASSYEVYELGGLLGANQDDLVAAPVVVWLLHSFERRFPGHRSIILVDEAWAALRSSRVAELLGEQLRTLRFRHAGIGFYSHALSDIRDSRIGRVVFAACKTRVLYPNPLATSDFRDLYATLGVTDAQMERIRKGVLKRDCFTQGDDKFGAFRLVRSPAELAVYGCTGNDARAAAQSLMQEYPEDWRERHLRAYGCNREADRLRSLRRQGTLNPHTVREELVGA